MELRLLTTFLKVAQLQSFSKAAESLGYSQSAVTVQVQQLENELGLLDPKPAARQDLVEAKYSYATNWPDHWKTEFAALNAVARPEPFCAEWNSLKDYIVAPFQQILANPNITREEAQALLDECAEKLYTDFPDAYRKP